MTQSLRPPRILLAGSSAAPNTSGIADRDVRLAHRPRERRGILTLLVAVVGSAPGIARPRSAISSGSSPTTPPWPTSPRRADLYASLVPTGPRSSVRSTLLAGVVDDVSDVDSELRVTVPVCPPPSPGS